MLSKGHERASGGTLELGATARRARGCYTNDHARRDCAPDARGYDL